MMENYQYFLISLVAYFKVVQCQEYTGILASTTVSGVMLIIVIIVGVILITWDKWFPSYMRNNGWSKIDHRSNHIKPLRRAVPNIQSNIRTGVNGRRLSLPLSTKEVFVVPKAVSEIHEFRKFPEEQPDYIGIDERFPRITRSSPVAFSNKQEMTPYSVENSNFSMKEDPEIGKEVVYASVNRQARHLSLENINRAEDDLVSTLLLY